MASRTQCCWSTDGRNHSRSDLASVLCSCKIHQLVRRHSLAIRVLDSQEKDRHSQQIQGSCIPATTLINSLPWVNLNYHSHLQLLIKPQPYAILAIRAWEFPLNIVVTLPKEVAAMGTWYEKIIIDAHIPSRTKSTSFV